MIDLLFGPQTVWFGVPALVGTLFFVLRLAMVTMGIDFGDGADADAGGGFDGAAGGEDAISVEDGVDHAESTSVFKFLSIQTITAFAMGFGWGGILGLETFGYSVGTSLLVAIGMGVAFAWFIVWLFQLMYAMESSGNVGIRRAMGCEGVAGSVIPAGGETTGRVRLTIGDRQRAFGARTDGDEIRMGARVRVTRVNNDNTVTVIGL